MPYTGATHTHTHTRTLETVFHTPPHHLASVADYVAMHFHSRAVYSPCVCIHMYLCKYVRMYVCLCILRRAVCTPCVYIYMYICAYVCT